MLLYFLPGLRLKLDNNRQHQRVYLLLIAVTSKHSFKYGLGGMLGIQISWWSKDRKVWKFKCSTPPFLTATIYRQNIKLLLDFFGGDKIGIKRCKLMIFIVCVHPLLHICTPATLHCHYWAVLWCHYATQLVLDARWGQTWVPVLLCQWYLSSDVNIVKR